MIKFKEFLANSVTESVASDAKTVHETIKSKMKNEDHQDALMSLYDDLNEDNKQLFETMLESDVEKLLEFALARIGE